MNLQEMIDQLENAGSSKDFVASSETLTTNWRESGNGLTAVEAVLRFMEDHPATDFGMPGPLVHFVETFFGKGYERKLAESISRKPTSHTVWMVNRVINGAKLPEQRKQMIEVLRAAKVNPMADQQAIVRIEHFLRRL
jgi:hypothetical protein